jgi:hypothetical protein
MAMTLYSLPRMTRDVDLVVEIQTPDIDRIYELFSADFYTDRAAVKRAVSGPFIFNIIHYAELVKADFIIRKNDHYHRLEFSRRRQLRIDDTNLWVVSPEDLILSKLIWAKDAGSELQQRDVAWIVLSVSDIDWDYLRKWAGELGLSELLAGLKQK